MDNTLQNLFGRSLSSLYDLWLVVAYVVCMFAVAAFRPQQIGSPVLFRNSYLLFAMYLILPALVDGIMRILPIDSPRASFGARGTAAREPAFVTVAVNVVVTLGAKILLAASICYGLASLRPGRAAPTSSPAERTGGH